MKKTKWSETLEKQSQRKGKTDCNVNNTRISDNRMHSALLLKNICLHENIQQQDGFQAPSHKVNAIIYINNFFFQEDL